MGIMASQPDLQQTIERLGETLEKVAKSRRAARREARRAREESKREKAIENASVAGGVFGLVMALVLVGFALTHLQFWWLLFVALGVGSGGAKQLALARERERRQVELQEPLATPGPHEIDALCDQLLVDLKASPEVVRSFLQQPEQTVEALRVTAKAVDQRRKDLAASATKDQLAALARQRQELQDRREASVDVEARVKFDSALRSLDGQEAALNLLGAVNDRLDGEYTSLLVLLQELKTRVAVARSTNTGSQLEGLQQNVQRLNAELQAITESLVMSPIDEGVAGDPVSSAGERIGEKR